MPDLEFRVDGAAPVAYCTTPTLGFKLYISNSSEEAIQSVALNCQVRIEAQRRRYGAGEKERLLELFGEPPRWSQTLRSLLWTHVGVNVHGFVGSTVLELPVTCTYDFNVLSAKYFHALDGEDVPVLLLFSGTIFFTDSDGQLQIQMISWNKEASYKLPVAVWRSMMEMYYPNTAWLALRRDVVERLELYKARSGLVTWEQTLESLLPGEPEKVAG